MAESPMEVTHRLGHVAVRVEDMARAKAFYQQLGLTLKAAGVSVGAVHDHRDGTASFYLQDSEGNWLEMLYEPPGGIGR
jgi:catechol-2,3-dioxygenase